MTRHAKLAQLYEDVHRHPSFGKLAASNDAIRHAAAEGGLDLDRREMRDAVLVTIYMLFHIAETTDVSLSAAAGLVQGAACAAELDARVLDGTER